jgi:hypothetical protein
LHAVRHETPDLEGEDLACEVAAATGVSRQGIATALRYYADYAEEINERVAANRDVADREERLWQAEQHLLGQRSA